MRDVSAPNANTHSTTRMGGIYGAYLRKQVHKELLVLFGEEADFYRQILELYRLLNRGNCEGFL
jgi:hypothetical protein